MHGGTAVPDHEDELGVGKQLQHVRAHLQGERVLVAQARGGLTVLGDHLQAERCDGAVQHLGTVSLLKTYIKLMSFEIDLVCSVRY